MFGCVTRLSHARRAYIQVRCERPALAIYGENMGKSCGENPGYYNTIVLVRSEVGTTTATSAWWVWMIAGLLMAHAGRGLYAEEIEIYLNARSFPIYLGQQSMDQC